MGDLHIELASRRITMRGRAVHLTPLEYRLLVALCHHVGQVVSRRQLLLEVWGPMRVQQAHFLRVCMAQLRRKLEARSRAPAVSADRAGGWLSAQRRVLDRGAGPMSKQRGGTWQKLCWDFRPDHAPWRPTKTARRDLWDSRDVQYKTIAS